MDMMWIFLTVVVSMSIYYNYKTKQSEYKHSRGENQGLERELDELRDRIETLETLVTDRSYQVRCEIDELGRK